MLTDHLVYRLLPVQVPLFWEAIKFACAKADEVPEDCIGNYFNRLLQDLLSDKAQCWVILDKDKVLVSITISRIVLDPISSKKIVEIQCMYAVSKQNDLIWAYLYQLAVDFAKQQGCIDVVFRSRNPRIWEKAATYGCKEVTRIYSFGLNS